MRGVKLDWAWAKDIAVLLVWLITLVVLIGNEIRKRRRYATSEDMDNLKKRVKVIEGSRGMDPGKCMLHWEKCKEEWKVYEDSVKNELKDIKVRLAAGDSRFTTLGVIQVAMCKHIKMPKEDIEMFKDAVFNGRVIKEEDI